MNMKRNISIQLSKLKHHLIKYKIINSYITKYYNKNYEKELKELLATIKECDNVKIDNDLPVEYYLLH